MIQFQSWRRQNSTFKMLFQLFLTSLIFISNVRCQGQKPYVFPIPFELPNRNDRADQCWLRIEDEELIETAVVYCHIAHEFLRGYIRDYNSRKMLEDDVDVSLWSELPRSQAAIPKPSETIKSNGQKIVDWKVTTVMDPITHTRLYVSQKADCKLVMYSREGMSNYQVECARILYFVNHHMNSSAVPSAKTSLIALCVLLLLLYSAH
ncbi:uncharacterized protein LOC126367853 [Pectinophora gossypiella]|uniref:uncharacterized protein LOC126367853 n=1 Tax=Pectinophora gossypiella TaxID=13191 RepID=UPI00214F5C5C|nr:uncharacterized protein LOC126367853 [Pectinophora gossypiella]